MKKRSLNMSNFNVVFFVSTSLENSNKVKAIVDRKEMNMIVVSGYSETTLNPKVVY